MIDNSQKVTDRGISEALVKVNNKILECYMECRPIKKNIISSRDQIKPWIKQSIKNNISKRQKSFELYQYGLSSEQEYK